MKKNKCDVKIVPINMNYEKIPDQSVLTDEICGIKDKHGNLL